MMQDQPERLSKPEAQDEKALRRAYASPQVTALGSFEELTEFQRAGFQTDGDPRGTSFS